MGVIKGSPQRERDKPACSPASLFVARTFKAIDFQGLWPNNDEMQAQDGLRKKLPAEQLGKLISLPHGGAWELQDAMEKEKVSKR